MIRVLMIACLLCGPLAATAQERGLGEARLAELRGLADQIALIEAGSVPEALVRAFLAVEGTRGERGLSAQLAAMHLGAMRTLERRAAETALAAMIEDNLSPREVAGVYAATVYYGRNCYGYTDAVRGLARRAPQNAGDAVWLALAALPRSPSLYLRDRSALRARVEVIIDEMEVQAQVDSTIAERLRELPLANIDSGKGCSGR